MTHTLTPAEIETLRRAKEGCSPGTIACTVEVLAKIALADIDRLSPPAPEVDEATRIWREMNAEGARACGSIPLMVQKWRNGERDNDVSAIAEISYLRNILSELIASKDAEIEQIVKRESGTVDQLGHAIRRYNQSQHELAALRAEIERLKLSSAITESLAEAHKHPFETCAYEDGYFDKAKPDTAPVVEVTQADEIAQTYADLHSEDGSWSVDCAEKLISVGKRIRAEAETRGRREVTKQALDMSYELHKQGYSAAYTLDAIEAHLRQSEKDNSDAD